MSTPNQYPGFSPLIDRLIVSCSHELKSPITSLQGLIQVAEYYSDNPEVKRCLQMMKQAAETMHHNLNSMEQYFKFMQREINTTTIDAAEIVEAVLGRYAQEIRNRDIKLIKQIRQLFDWHADRIYSEIILDNLISNAIHFQDEEKLSKEVRIVVTVDKNQTDIEVCDNGIGIERYNQDKVLEIFSRNSTLSRGCGIGLFLTNSLIKKMQGMCTLSSREGLGTKVKITMPNAFKTWVALMMLMVINSFCLTTQSQSLAVDVEKPVDGMNYGSTLRFHSRGHSLREVSISCGMIHLTLFIS